MTLTFTGHYMNVTQEPRLVITVEGMMYSGVSAVVSYIKIVYKLYVN